MPARRLVSELLLHGEEGEEREAQHEENRERERSAGGDDEDHRSGRPGHDPAQLPQAEAGDVEGGMGALQTHCELLGHSEQPGQATSRGAGEGPHHLEHGHQRPSARGRSGQARARQIGAHTVDERRSAEPPQLAQEDGGAGPPGHHGDNEEADHRTNTLSSSGSRSICPAHSQQATIMASAMSTASCPNGVW